MNQYRIGIFIALALCSISCALGATVPFEPRRAPKALEPWRWRELEPLNGYNLVCGTENADGSLVLGTTDGVVVYDGYEVTRHPFPDDYQIEEIYQIYLSLSERVYIYTSSGIFAFEKGEFELIKSFQIRLDDIQDLFIRNAQGLELVYLPGQVYRLEGDAFVAIPQIRETVTDLAFDSHNRLWMVVQDRNEIIRYQFEKNELSEPLDRKSFEIDAIRLLESKLVGNPTSDEMWAINWRQLPPAFRYSSESDSWLSEDPSSYSGSNSHMHGLLLDDDSLLLFLKTNILLHHGAEWHSIDYPDFKIPTNEPFDIIRKNGNFIIGGRGESVFEIDYDSEKWESYPGLHFQCETSDRRQWFLTLEGKIVEHDTVYNTWGMHTGAVIDTPLSIIRTEDDFIWASGAHQGEPAVSYFNGRHWTLDRHPELFKFISHLSAKQLSNGDIFFGSGGEEPLMDRGGAALYRKSTSGYEFEYIKPPLLPIRPVGVAESHADTVLFGGFGLHISTTDFSSPVSTDPQFENDPWVDHVIDDDRDHIWVAVWDRGLLEYDGNNWQQHIAPLRIGSNQVSFLLRDNKRADNIWIASSRGISRFDGENWYPMAMHEDIRFNRESGTMRQSSDGSIWVNTATRDWYFRETPSFNVTKQLYETFKSTRHRIDTQAPAVKIVAYEKETVRPAHIFVEWEGVDKWSHTPAQNLRYSFRTGERPWSEFTSKTNTILLDVEAGEHLFQVRALDSDGNISTQYASAQILVTLPLWQRPWAVLSAATVFCLILILVAMLLRQRIRHIIQLDEFKLQFFTNISHELRTPLTVILGPLESQLDKLPDHWDKKPLQIAHKNARKMLRLIDQILDFRSAELGNIQLNQAHADIIACVRESVEMIKPLADERFQTLILNAPDKPYPAWFDAEKIDKILSNLISNAVKYTQRQGLITVSVTIEKGEPTSNIVLSVEDNGSGIPKNKLERIFEIFYRIGNQPDRKVRGSGIGLAYTKILVDACSGMIKVESPVAKVDGKSQGARFTVSLPAKAFVDSNVADSPAQAEPQEELAHNGKPLIVIAEDDDDIRSFLVDELEENYSIIQTENGEQALRESTTRIPDIVLTDIMMPVMDGKELCRQIKSSQFTSHIPVIMLTALKSDEHELEGLEKGADDYIAKPIRTKILKQHIRNLLDLRTKLHERFRAINGEAKLSPKEVTSNPLDEAFIQKAIDIVERNMQDPLFDVEQFASLMAMSRMTLYRKFKAVSGDSPSEFIRSIRLNQAATLLRKRALTISEIADQIGMSDVSYFSASFKKRFKQTPSQYQKHSGDS